MRLEKWGGDSKCVNLQKKKFLLVVSSIFYWSLFLFAMFCLGRSILHFAIDGSSLVRGHNGSGKMGISYKFMEISRCEMSYSLIEYSH
jgi:hypothetical protein